MSNKRKPLTSDEYVAKQGTCCPFCWRSDVSGDEVVVDGGGAHQKVSCNACNEEWTDIYVLTGYEQ